MRDQQRDKQKGKNYDDENGRLRLFPTNWLQFSQPKNISLAQDREKSLSWRERSFQRFFES